MSTEHDDFFTHTEYFGCVGETADTRVFAYDTFGQRRSHAEERRIQTEGGVFGFVHAGTCTLDFNGRSIELRAGEWFQTPNGARVWLHEDSRVVIFQRFDYVGVWALGAIEQSGRLRYIDGCWDSVLSSPIKLGEPCLNALFIPTGVHQTMHTHPSTRAGVIIDGNAVCVTRTARHELRPGMVFVLPRDGWHKFLTDFDGAAPLRLVAFHPDSGFGPTDESHPMLNRTLVHGVSANVMPNIRTR
jgi:quercetin dioxygenase-like cupin family protein